MAAGSNCGTSATRQVFPVTSCPATQTTIRTQAKLRVQHANEPTNPRLLDGILSPTGCLGTHSSKLRRISCCTVDS